MRKTGTVVGWNSRGFGFVRVDRLGPGQEPDVFVHASELAEGLRGLEKGQRVSFLVKQTAKGIQAADVRVLDVSEATEKTWFNFIGGEPLPKD